MPQHSAVFLIMALSSQAMLLPLRNWPLRNLVGVPRGGFVSAVKRTISGDYVIPSV